MGAPTAALSAFELLDCEFLGNKEVRRFIAMIDSALNWRESAASNGFRRLACQPVSREAGQGAWRPPSFFTDRECRCAASPKATGDSPAHNAVSLRRCFRSVRDGLGNDAGVGLWPQEVGDDAASQGQQANGRTQINPAADVASGCRDRQGARRLGQSVGDR